MTIDEHIWSISIYSDSLATSQLSGIGPQFKPTTANAIMSAKIEIPGGVRPEALPFTASSAVLYDCVV